MDRFDDLLPGKDLRNTREEPKTWFLYRAGKIGKFLDGTAECRASIFRGDRSYLPLPLSRLEHVEGFQRTVAGKNFEEIGKKLVLGYGDDRLHDTRYNLNLEIDSVVFPNKGVYESVPIFPAGMKDLTALVKSYQKYKNEKSEGDSVERQE